MAAIRRSASFVLAPKQSAAMYSRYEGSRDAVSASASPGVNWKAFTSFTRTLATLPLLLIVPSGSEIVSLSRSLRPFPLCAKVGSASTSEALSQNGWMVHVGRWPMLSSAEDARGRSFAAPLELRTPAYTWGSGRVQELFTHREWFATLARR